MKKIIAKIYHSDDTLLNEIFDFKFDGFTKDINSGMGECVLTIAEKFNYSGGGFDLGNYVKLYVSDEDTVNVAGGMVLIYNGYISMIEPYVEGNKEYILVHSIGEYTKLSLDILKNGTATTLYSDSAAGLTVTADGSAADIGLQVRAVIDRFVAENPSAKFTYTQISIPLTSTTAQYMFQSKTYREALDKLREMAPVGYFFYVDEENVVSLKPKPTSPTHRFEFGKHFGALRIEKSMEAIRNVIVIWNGEPGTPGTPPCVRKSYENAASISQYGRRTERYVDRGINDVSAADAVAAGFLGSLATPEIKVYCTIFDGNGSSQGYDIESIQPGDTCTFVGFNDDVANLLQENMLITSVKYTLDKVELTIEAIKSGLVDWQEKTSKQVEQVSGDGTPATYTT